jgi:hypothetical protein
MSAILEMSSAKSFDICVKWDVHPTAFSGIVWDAEVKVQP